VSADAFTVILISLEDLRLCFLSGQSVSSKWIVDPFQAIRNSRNLRVGRGDLLFLPAMRASKCSIKSARSAARAQTKSNRPSLVAARGARWSAGPTERIFIASQRI